MKKSQKGFTLIELLVVIALLGVMSLLVIPSFNGSLRKSRDSKRKTDLAQIAKALEVYYNDTGMYPVSNGGKIQIGASIIDWGSSLSSGSVVYMTKLPKDSGSRTYRYVSLPDGSSTPTGYYLMAQLENTSDPDYYPVDGSTYPCGGTGCSFVVTSTNVNPPGAVFPTSAVVPTNGTQPTIIDDKQIPTIVLPTPTTAVLPPVTPTLAPKTTITEGIDPVVPTSAAM